LEVPLPLHPFDQLVQSQGESLRLAQAALLFACDHYRNLDVTRWLLRLDDLAAAVDDLHAEAPADRVEAIRDVLVHREGLTGDSEDYYDPRNSFLHEVLTRGCGLPIALSAIWLDVAERLGWSFAGVALPGHYIIRTNESNGQSIGSGPGADLLVDPFTGGRVIDREECSRIVSGLTGKTIRISEAQLAPTGRLDTLARMLNNLRLVYTQRQNWGAAALVIMRMLALDPESAELVQQLRIARGMTAQLN
jgi:regulator of sirC expression with transglutaminase-like and TPR domain